MKLRTFSLLLFTLFLIQSGKAQDTNGYRFEITEWLEKDATGNLISKVDEYWGVLLLKGQAAVTRANMQLEFRSSIGEILRLGDNTHFSLLHDRQVRLSKGEFLLYLPPSRGPFRIHGPKTMLELSQSGVVIAQATTNGGLKLVCLEGNLRLHVQGENADLEAGKLYFIPPGKSRLGKSLHINLSLFIKTTGLLQNFKPSLPVQKNIQRNAFRQSFNIKNQTPLYVGDAKTAEDFDLLLVQPE
jgi:hypothetical protein